MSDVKRRKNYCSPKGRKSSIPADITKLTIRERTWRLLDKGLYDHQIAEDLHCSEQYVAMVRENWEILKGLELDEEYLLKRRRRFLLNQRVVG